MSGRVTVVLFSLFLMARVAAGQCDFLLQSSTPYRASILDLSADGSDRWAAAGFGVQLYDQTVDPPRLIGFVTLPGSTRVVYATGVVVYAGGTAGLSVVRKRGSSLELVRSVSTEPVNDLTIAQGVLYAATASGVSLYTLGDPLNPALLGSSLRTSAGGALSLAPRGSTVWVADGDATVEGFSTGAATPIASIQSLPRSTSVRATADRLYVSDGQQTEVFFLSGTTVTKLGTMRVGATALAEGPQNVVFVAGDDRRLHAFDATTPDDPVELFEAELVPNGGTINRITSLDLAGQRLFAGGGDMGLASWDTSRFNSPYPLRSYASGASGSVAATASSVFVALASGGLGELKRLSNGALTTGRSPWATSATHRIHDSADGFLLTSAGSVLTWWTVTSSTPTPVTTVTMGASVRAAVLLGTRALVLLDDQSIWTVDLAQAAPVPAATGRVGLFLTASSAGRAWAEVTEEGTTNVQFALGPEGSMAPTSTASVPGVATAFALSGSTAAVFTFRGITLIDFAASPPRQTLLPGSNTAFVRDLEFAGSRLIDLTSNGIRIWNVAVATLQQDIGLPVEGVAMDVTPEGNAIAVATADGVAWLSLTSGSEQPRPIGVRSGNSYHRKAVASRDMLYLFDGRTIEIYETGSGATPSYLASLSQPGAVDVGASDSYLFTLTSGGVLSQYGRQGTLLRTATIDEGTDAVVLRLSVVGGAPWVSLSRGCQTIGCERKTLVFDPRTLALSSTLSGGVLDVAVSGPKAYVLFEVPAVIRTYSLSSPGAPVELASAVYEGSFSSLAWWGGSVYALGDRLYAYSDSGLTKTGEQVLAGKAAPGQSLAIDGGCAVINGRTATADAYVVGASWSAARSLALPGSFKSIAVDRGRLFILTDSSLEIWSRSAPEPPARRRVSR